MLKEFKAFVQSMRIKHWIKNILIFVPAFFGGKITNLENLMLLLYGGGVFSLVASSIYIINDLNDVSKDVLHPIKCKRPIASGKLNKHTAFVGAFILLVLGFLGLIFAFRNIFITLILIIYIISNLAYSVLGAKNIPVVDIVLVSSGYILRIFFGGFISETNISIWLFITIFSISFFMATQKRLKELENGTDFRNVLQEYSIKFLDTSKIMSLCSGLVFFILWCMEFSSNNKLHFFPYVASSIGFISLLLYLYDAEKADTGDPVDVILHNKILLFLLSFFVIMFMLEI